MFDDDEEYRPRSGLGGLGNVLDRRPVRNVDTIAVVKALGVLAEAEHVGASGRRTAGAALEDVFADPSSVNMRLMRAESSAGVSTAAAKFVKVFRISCAFARKIAPSHGTE